MGAARRAVSRPVLRAERRPGDAAPVQRSCSRAGRRSARSTPLHAAEPGLAPSGFVFHMSRCGSTLVSQMLARAAGDDRALRAAAARRAAAAAPPHGGCERRAPGRPAARHAERAGPARSGERRLFVKFHAWHVLELPFIARTFPGVPWAFVFREPRAVLRSQIRSTGAELVAGNLDPAYFGLDAATAHALPPDEYGARVLAAFCTAALDSTRARAGGVRRLRRPARCRAGEAAGLLRRAARASATPSACARRPARHEGRRRRVQPARGREHGRCGRAARFGPARRSLRGAARPRRGVRLTDAGMARALRGIGCPVGYDRGDGLLDERGPLAAGRRGTRPGR